jgi:adenosylcobinamide-GDP ribazoletransferase
MITARQWAERLVADLKASLVFCTRLPLGGHAGPTTQADAQPTWADGAVGRASWAFPLAGALVGAVGGLVYWLAYRLDLAPLPAAALALIATLALTGALHEDGLADTGDGFGGGKDRDHKLAIMRDSHIGAYGTCAMITSIILRWSAVAAIAQPRSVFFALLCTHAAARATLPAFMLSVPPARSDGLSVAAGRPSWECGAIAGLLGVIALALALGPTAAAIAVIVLIAAGFAMAWLSMRQIGGQTGDVIGALEQINECLILLVAAVALKPD